MRALLLTLFLSVSLLSLRAQPLAVIAINDTVICIGDTVLLEAVASGGTGPYTYQWTTALGLDCDTCATTLAYPTDSTTYMVVVTDSAADMDTAYVTIVIDTGGITDSSGLVSVGVFGNGPYIADSLLFTIDSSLAGGGDWYVILNGATAYETVTGTGSDLVKYYLENFCMAVKEDWQCPMEVRMCYTPLGSCKTYCNDTTIIIGYLGGSIAEKNTIHVNLYPNPVNDVLAISSDIFNAADIVIYNAIGQMVLQHQASDLISEQLDVSHFTPGIYILHIQTKDGLAVHRVVKN